MSHTQIGYAWVMLTTSFACLTSDWLTCLSSDWLILVNSQNLILAKNFTAYVCVVASGSQCHPAMAHVASHKYLSKIEVLRVATLLSLLFFLLVKSCSLSRPSFLYGCF